MVEFIKSRKEIALIVLTGAAMGIIGVWLAALGNPRNSGICISCFMENAAGALGLHSNDRMQYLRPELVGFVLGGTASAMAAREFRSEGGSSPMLRFLSGVILIVGCSIFLGCPIKMVLRFASGDYTAFAGVGGLVAGVWLGYQFLRQGFYLGDHATMPKINGLLLPILMAAGLLAVVFQPDFLHFSATGPGSQKASRAISLGAGLFLGFMAQRSRFCVTGSIGNFVVTRDTKLLWGLLAMIACAYATAIFLGLYQPGFEAQPGSHTAYGWSFLGMALVGITSTMIGGCPFRQLILASQGSSDAGSAGLGMVAGGAVVQAWGITSTNSGPTVMGEISILIGLAVVLALGVVMRARD